MEAALHWWRRSDHYYWLTALLAPRPITFVGEMPAAYGWTQEVYVGLGQGNNVRGIATAAEWRPG